MKNMGIITTVMTIMMMIDIRIVKSYTTAFTFQAKQPFTFKQQQQQQQQQQQYHHYYSQQRKIMVRRMSSIEDGTSIISTTSSSPSTTVTMTPTTTINSNDVTDDSDSNNITVSTTRLYQFDIKDCVILFGKLAEKYIVLDSSGGQCCYSGCSNCEYRLPGGGYIMSDQSSSRPKWIPTYVQRLQSNNEHHTSKWSTMLFENNKDNDSNSNTDNNDIVSDDNENKINRNTKNSNLYITKSDFIQKISNEMEYSPPLGGPYVSASYATSATASINDAIEYLYDVVLLSNNNKKDTLLSKTRMSVKLKQLSNGQEGLTWPNFSEALMMGMKQ